jgi:tetratricopeptide (TPR) repeat protein
MATPQPAPQDHSETLRLGLERHQAGDTPAAERLYGEVLAADPHEPTALYLCGMLHLEAGRLETAEPMLEQVAALRPDVAEGHLALAGLAERQGRLERAIAEYRKVLAILPGHPVALTSLASILVERGFNDDADFDSAIEVCRQAAALLPDPAPAHAMLGGMLLAAGRATEAVQAYCAALTTQPSNAGAWAGLAAALLRTDRPEPALDAADAALALDHAFTEAWLARGGALLALHRPEEAAQAFEHGVALAPDHARMHLGLGDAYAELELEELSMAHLARAVELDPSAKWAQANLGSMLYRCGRPEAAEPHLRAALALDPAMPVAHRNLAGVLADRGEADEARRHRDRSYELANLHIDRAPEPAATVLVLTTSDSGNIPHRHLLPKSRYSRIDWFIEYAREGQAAELPPYDIVFNIIGDPDHSGRTDAPVAAFLRQCERPVLNDPAKVAPTRRDRLPSLIGDTDGVLAPRAVRFDAQALAVRGLAAAIADAGLSLPLLIRPMGSHGGEGLTLVRTAAELEAVSAPHGVYATEFVDFASPADGRYRKYRVIFVDRAPFPYHLAIKDHWLVHYYTAEMTGDVARQAEEQRFLDDPAAALGPNAMAALSAIGARLDLDFAGVDFSILPDGRLLVFEANPTMLVHPEPDGEFAYKNPYVERITSAFQTLVNQRACEPR